MGYILIRKLKLDTFVEQGIILETKYVNCEAYVI